MFELIGDKKELYQWDRDRRITVPKGVTKIRFSNLTHGVSTDKIVSGNEVEIPPELLRIYGDLYVWGGDENNTEYSKHFDVIKSPKPADYIYTPEELKTWEDLQNQIGNLDNLNTKAKDNLVNAINELLLNGGGAGGNGVGIEKIEQTTKSTEDNGENIITVTLTNGQKYTFSVFNGSKGSKGDKGDKGEQGAKGENGKSAFEYAVEGGYSGTEEQFGVDLSKVSNKITAPITAQIGQTIVVKAVDDAMRPTEWECANLPTGGGGGSEWRKIADIVLEEETTTIDISKDINGNSFELMGFYVYVRCPSAPSQQGANFFRVYFYDKNFTQVTPFCVNGINNDSFFEAMACIELSDDYSPLLQTLRTRTNKFGGFTIPSQNGEFPSDQHLKGAITKLSFSLGMCYPAGTIIKVFKTR